MKRVEVSVPLAEARKRALVYLASEDRRVLIPANCVGYAIWPGVKMTSQGAGGAASRILRGLQKDGLVEWLSGKNWGHSWGWRITATGRRLGQREDIR